MSDTKPGTVIVGGGVIGAMCGWYLTQAGRDVTIVDKGDFGAACSHANCGYVSPSHAYPLPGPGKLAYGFKGLFQNNGALKIRPGFSPSLWWWLLKFAARCNKTDAMIAGEARTSLLHSSRQLYEELISGQQLDVEWKTDGLLFVFRSPKLWEEFAAVDRDLRIQFDVAAECLDGDALQKLEPALKPGLAGAFHYHGDAHLRPDRLMSELRRLLEDAGAKIVTGKEVTGFRKSGGRINAVVCGADEIPGDEFVVATGAWAPELTQMLGCRIPVQPGKGYSITMPRPQQCPKFPMLLEDVHVGITPFDSGYRIGSTMELAGYNEGVVPQRLEYLKRGATEFLHEPLAEPIEEQWFGWRPMTWDGMPYIDKTPRFDNAWIAAGHNMLGLSMGTGTGRLIAEMVTGQEPHLDPSPFRLGR